MELSNRLVMASMTRNRATADGVPTPLTATYYAQRASAGLIIAEASAPNAVGQPPPARSARAGMPKFDSAECGGAGTPVVLLHGGGMDSRLWDAVFPQLARHHTVVRFDARGLGRSPSSAEPFWDVVDLRAVLDHFGIERAALVGLSLGGETSLDFALAHPERVSAMALIGSSVSGYRWSETPGLSAYEAARRERDAKRLAELELSIWASMGTAAVGGEQIEGMVADNAERRFAGGTSRASRTSRPFPGSTGSRCRRWSSTATGTIRRSV